MATTRPAYVEQTTTTTTSTPGAMRNYPSSSSTDYNNRSSGNYNRDQDFGDSRHHGRWTASGEATDLEGNRQRGQGFARTSSSDYNRDRDYERRDRDSDRDFERRDRDYSRDYDRRDYGVGSSSRGMSYGNGYDFTAGTPHYGQTYPHYGSSASSFPFGSGSYGSHPYGTGLGMHHGYDTSSTYPHHYGGYHSGYSSSYGYPHSYGSSFPHSYGASYPHTYGSSFPHTYGSSYPQHSYGMMPHYGSSSSMIGSRGLRSTGGFITPEADIYELGNDYIIEMDLPGHSKDHIETKRVGNELVILSKPPTRSHNFHINERSLGQGHVHRKLYLPADAEADRINANLTNGVLKLIIPRTMASPVSVASTGASTPIVTKDTTTTTTTTARV